MLIKTKLYSSSLLVTGLLVVVAIFTLISFGSLSNHLQSVVTSANSSVDSAQKAVSGSTEGSQKLEKINAEILLIVDGINRANQRTQLLSRKVDDISKTLQELNETIEEVSEDIYDQDSLELFEEISDEVSDISERLRREALLSLNNSSKQLNAFSDQIVVQSGQINALNEFTKQQVVVSNQAKEASLSITSQAEKALDEIVNSQGLIVSMLFILALISIVSSLLIIKAAIIPINRTVNLMREIGQGDGDLTARLAVQGRDEMAMISESFNHFVEKIQKLLVEIRTSSNELASVSNETYSAMVDGSNTIHQQEEEIQQIAAAITELTASSQEVAHNTQAASAQARSANEFTHTGRVVVDKAHDSVASLVDDVEEAVNVINSLSVKSVDVSSVVNVIKDVAEQTNLLALNAAIEAARAGEKGRGFAVVADEVRALAARANTSSGEIQAIIEEMQQLIEKAVTVMQVSHDACKETVEGADEASSALASITEAIQIIDDMNTQIASAAEQQTAVSEEINQRITQVNDLSGNTSHDVERTVRTCESLNQINERLNQQISQFKI